MMKLLSKYHKLWIAMGLSIGIRSDLVEDFIHEMYLKLHKYISDPKKIMYNENEPNNCMILKMISDKLDKYSIVLKKIEVIKIATIMKEVILNCQLI